MAIGIAAAAVLARASDAGASVPAGPGAQNEEEARPAAVRGNRVPTGSTDEYPVRHETAFLGGGAWAVAVGELAHSPMHLAYVAETNRIAVYDLSSSDPRLIGASEQFDFEQSDFEPFVRLGKVNRLAARAEWVVAAAPSELLAYRWGGTRLVMVERFPTAGPVRHLEIAGHYAVALDRSRFVYLDLDLLGLGSSSRLEALDLDSVHAMAVDGSTVYLLTSGSACGGCATDTSLRAYSGDGEMYELGNWTSPNLELAAGRSFDVSDGVMAGLDVHRSPLVFWELPSDSQDPRVIGQLEVDWAATRITAVKSARVGHHTFVLSYRGTWWELSEAVPPDGGDEAGPATLTQSDRVVSAGASTWGQYRYSVLDLPDGVEGLTGTLEESGLISAEIELRDVAEGLLAVGRGTELLIPRGYPGAVRRYDLSRPTEPVELAPLVGIGSINDVDVSDGYLYTADPGGSVGVYKLRESGAQPDLVSNISAPATVVQYDSSVAVDGGVAWVASSGIVRGYDVSDPERPREIAALPCNCSITDLAAYTDRDTTLVALETLRTRQDLGRVVVLDWAEGTPRLVVNGRSQFAGPEPLTGGVLLAKDYWRLTATARGPYGWTSTTIAQRDSTHDCPCALGAAFDESRAWISQVGGQGMVVALDDPLHPSIIEATGSWRAANADRFLHRPGGLVSATSFADGHRIANRIATWSLFGAQPVPAASVTFETIPQRLYHPQPPDERERFDAYGDYIYVAAENSGLAVIRLPESGPLGRAYFPSAVH